MSVPYIFSGKTVTIYIGRPYVVNENHPNYNAIIDGLNNDIGADKIASLVDIPRSIISTLSNNRFQYDERSNQILFDGNVVHGAIIDRILEHLDKDMPVKNLLNFYERLSKNPSRSSVQELFDFLENCTLPITEDGHFLAYKMVTSEYKDGWTETIDNRVGEVIPRLERSQVDDNRNNFCGAGYHVCAMEYIGDAYVQHVANGGHLMVTKVNPADVVSVPLDSNCKKIRVTSYLVVDEITDWTYDDVGYHGTTIEDNFTDRYSDFEDDDQIDWIDEEEFCENCGNDIYDCSCGVPVAEPQEPAKPDYRQKLTATIVAMIKHEMFENGLSNVEIAKKYNISERQTGRIRSGENWGHVDYSS